MDFDIKVKFAGVKKLPLFSDFTDKAMLSRQSLPATTGTMALRKVIVIFVATKDNRSALLKQNQCVNGKSDMDQHLHCQVSFYWSCRRSIFDYNFNNMKKIIIAFDGHRFSEGAFTFAQKLNEVHPVLLTGVFLPQEDFANLWSYADSGLAGPMYIPYVQELDTGAIEKNIETFEKRCQLNGIDYRVHKDFMEFAIPELKKETRFADLLILGSEKFYKLLAQQQPNDYLKNVLHDAECPVVVVPENFIFPSGLILAYDGSASSVYAIKQFANLFPEFCKRKTTLVFAGKDDAEIPDKAFIEELATRHFPDLTITKLAKEQKKHFAEWLQTNKNPLLITGAFGRSDLSQLFRKSFVADVIAAHHTPVFIAHV